jgi:hypothetical protein
MIITITVTFFAKKSVYCAHVEFTCNWMLSHFRFLREGLGVLGLRLESLPTLLEATSPLEGIDPDKTVSIHSIHSIQSNHHDVLASSWIHLGLLNVSIHSIQSIHKKSPRECEGVPETPRGGDKDELWWASASPVPSLGSVAFLQNRHLSLKVLWMQILDPLLHIRHWNSRRWCTHTPAPLQTRQRDCWVPCLQKIPQEVGLVGICCLSQQALQWRTGSAWPQLLAAWRGADTGLPGAWVLRAMPRVACIYIYIYIYAIQ